MNQQRRTSPRVAARIPVRYGLVTIDRADTAENLSEGGLFIRTNRPMVVGSSLQLEIGFPGRTVCHGGEVVWAIRVPEPMESVMVCGMGIRFTETEPGWSSFFRSWKDGLDGR